MTTTTRKYAFIKIEKGDYLLASNDRSTILRFSTYNEDGSTEGLPAGIYWIVKCKPASAWPEGGFVFTEQMERWLEEDWETYYWGSRSRKEAEHNVSDLIDK